MTQTEYDREDEFETYLCFSAVFRQKLNEAEEIFEKLADETDADYVRETVVKIMKPLCDLKDHRIGRFPYTPEKSATVLMFCTDISDAERFIEEQYRLYEDYFTLLPAFRPQNQCTREWEEIKTGFEKMRKALHLPQNSEIRS